MEDVLELRDGYVNNQGLNHWHTVSWDPGVADYRVLSVCYDCLCLFRTVMSLPRDWVELFVWTGHNKGYCRSTGWELRYLPRIYPPCVVDRLGGYLTELQLHDPRLLKYVGAPESARLLSRSPEYWLHHLGHEKTLSAALQLQHDAGLILSNVQVLQQFVKALNRTSSEVMQIAFRRKLFPADAIQQLMPSYRVRRAAHYMAAMGLWSPPINQGIRGPLPSVTCNACMSCNNCFPDLPQ